MYAAVRDDGRWDQLKAIGGQDGTVYGVASEDDECPKGKYRYTIAVKAPSGKSNASSIPKGLFHVHISETEWLVFEINHFETQYGDFWRRDPYATTRELGYSFNNSMGLHLDVYPPDFSSDNDYSEFWLPVVRSA